MVNGRSGLRDRAGRILRLMRNYWIVLVLFTAISLLVGNGGVIPGNLKNFAGSIVLLHSYNGAWWYLNTYVILLLLPPKVLFFPVHRLKLIPGFLFCGAVQVGWYLIRKFGFLPDVSEASAAVQFLNKEWVNLVGILPNVWVGGFLCKYRVVAKIREWYGQKVSGKLRGILLLAAAICVFVGTNLVHKVVLMGFVAVVTFLLFNLWEKGPLARKAMLFLGKHSTNIWLVHMFFYSGFLKDAVLAVRYPIPMLLMLLALCVCSSWVILRINGILSCKKL